MIEHLPDRLDLLATAEAGRALRGRIAVDRLGRLLPALASAAGTLQVELELGKAADGTCYLSGSIQGDVALKCQRCMEDLSLPLDLVFLLGLVRGEADAQALPECYEPLIVTAEPAHIADVVADEVLLALPIVPAHTQVSECREFVKEYLPEQDEQRENPFAALAELKQKLQ